MRWEKTFELSVPTDEAWKAFRHTEQSESWNRALSDDAYYSAGGVQVEIDDERPGERIAWTESTGDDRVQMEVTFTAVDTGTRITIARSGFGTGDAWTAIHGSRWLGWMRAMHEYALAAEHGIHGQRLFRWRSYSGMLATDAAAGLRVVAVDDHGWAQRAGLQAGDLVIAIGDAPIYDLADLWTLHGILEPERVVSVDAVRAGEVVRGEAAIPAFAGWR